MAYSFTGYYIAVVLALIMIIIATILVFFAASYLNTTNTATSNATVVANNQTARWWLFGAGIVGIIIAIILFFFIFYVYSGTNIDILTLTTPVLVASAQFGWGYIIGFIILIIMLILMAAFAFIGVTYIDSSTNNQNGSSARTMAIIAGVIAFLSIIFIGIMWWWIRGYNSYLEALLIAPTAVSKPRGPSLAPYNFVSNPDSLGDFEGTITVRGNIKERPNYVYIDGKLVESDVQSTASIPINDVYSIKPNKVIVQQKVIEERIVQQPVVQERVVRQPVVQERIVRQPVVQERVVRQPIVEDVQEDIIFPAQPNPNVGQFQRVQRGARVNANF
jgi:hypothetical protein